MKKFIRFFLIGLLSVFLLVVSQQMRLVTISADNEDYETVGPMNPAYQEGQTPIDNPNPLNPAYQEGQTPISSSSQPVAPVPAPVEAPAAPAAPACPISSDQYPQCGGTTGLEDKDPTHTYMVTRFTDCHGNIAKPYQIEDKGNLGQCRQAPAPSNPAPAPAPAQPSYPPVNPAPPAPAGAPSNPAPYNPVPQSTQSLPACPTPGQAGTVQQPSCSNQWSYDDFRVLDRWSDGSPKSIYSEYSANRHCQGTILCAQPAQQTYTPPVNQCRSITCPPAPANYYYSGQLTYTCDPTVALTCGTLIAQVTGNPTCAIVANPQSGNSPLNVSFTGTGYAAAGKTVSAYSWDLDGNGSYGDASGQSASRVYNNSTSVGLQVTDSAGQIGYCSTTVNINPAQVASAPQVVYQNVGVGQQPVYVSALPKTGLPLVAWAVGAFLPAGLGLKRVSRVKKQLDADPNYLWENRQYHRS